MPGLGAVKGGYEAVTGMSFTVGNQEVSTTQRVIGAGIAIFAAVKAAQWLGPTDNLKHATDAKHLDAARIEQRGGSVGINPKTGKSWDHLKEVQNAQRGLVNRIQAIKSRLADASLSDTEREALQRELSEASKLLDRTEETLPR